MRAFAVMTVAFLLMGVFVPLVNVEGSPEPGMAADERRLQYGLGLIMEDAPAHERFEVLVQFHNPEEEWTDVGQPEEPSAEQEERRPERPGPPEGTKPSLPLEQYAGNYTSRMVGDVKVELRDGKLFLSFQAYPSAELEHRHLDTFRASFQDRLLSDTDVSFTINAAARITEMTVSSLGTFRRVER